MKKKKLKMDQLPQLPKTSDREPNTFYIYKEQIRFWNGRILLCQHKKHICNICNPEAAEKKQQYRQNNPERHQQNQRQWRQKNPEYDRQYFQKWRRNNRERERQNHQKWTQNNPEYYRQWRQNNPERSRQYDRQWRLNNSERNRQNKQRWRQNNSEKLRQLNRQWKLTSDKNRCNDLCIDKLHSETEKPSYKYKKKFGYEDGSVRVCYICAIADIRNEQDKELKKQKKNYYQINTRKTEYLFRIEYAIICHLNEYSLIDQLNQKSLNIHDKDIVSIIGKTTTIEMRPDRAYLINNNNLIIFEIDEKGVKHEKSIERLLHIRNRLQEKFEDDLPINLYVFRFNINEQEEKTNMVERREFPSGYEQKEVGYQISKYGCEIIEDEFLPVLEYVYSECNRKKNIENDKQLMIYEFNVPDMESMDKKYEEDNYNIEDFDSYVDYY